MELSKRERERETRFKLKSLSKVISLILFVFFVIALSSCRQAIIPIPPFWMEDETLPSGAWDEYFTGGNGSEANPYSISDQSEINQIAELVNDGTTTFNGVYFEITQPITLTNFTPIGTKDIFSKNPFEGVFRGSDPDNKTEITLSYSDSQLSSKNRFVGLFGCIGDGAVIENLKVKGTITNSMKVNTTSGTPSAGLITGHMTTGSTIQNCDVYGSVSAQRAGGIAGEMEGGNIINCTNYAEIKGLAPEPGGSNYVGGITGSATDQSTLKQVYNRGNISSERGTTIGGIIGALEDGSTLSDSYNYGTIKGKYSVGGIAGSVKGNGTLIDNCHNEGIMQPDDTATYETIERIGGIAGTLYESAKISNSSNKSELNFPEFKYVGGIVGISLTNATIDNSTNNANITGKYRIGGIIGQAQNSTITGKDDVITNNGSITATGKIVSENDVGFAGGIAGRADNTVFSYVSNNGLVKGTEDASSIGGLIGYSGNSSVTNSKNEGNVELTGKTKSQAGGLIGYMHNTTIENCTANSNVSAVYHYAGAVTGRASATSPSKNVINNIILSGSISADYGTGGIIGYYEKGDTDIKSINIDTSNLTITATASSNIKGNLIGAVVDSQVSISFENVEINGKKITEENPLEENDGNIGKGFSSITATYI